MHFTSRCLSGDEQNAAPPDKVLKMKSLYAERLVKRLQWVTLGYKSWPCSAQSNHVAYVLLMQHTVWTNCAKNPSVTSTYTKPDTHTHYCLHLYASQPPTEISPSSSRGQTIEQLICVLALTKRRSSSICICISPDAIYTLNLMCQECENSDRCSSSLPPSLTWQQQTKTRLWKPVLIAAASAEQLACADI